MKKPRTEADGEIRGEIAKALTRALKRRGIAPEKAAALLQVEVGTLYKYLAGDMIPGGHVLWRACCHLGMVLDRTGFHLTRDRVKQRSKADTAGRQFEFPWVNQFIAGDKVHLTIRKKDPESEYVHVAMRIRVGE